MFTLTGTYLDFDASPKVGAIVLSYVLPSHVPVILALDGAYLDRLTPESITTTASDGTFSLTITADGTHVIRRDDNVSWIGKSTGIIVTQSLTQLVATHGWYRALASGTTLYSTLAVLGKMSIAGPLISTGPAAFTDATLSGLLTAPAVQTSGTTTTGHLGGAGSVPLGAAGAAAGVGASVTVDSTSTDLAGRVTVHCGTSTVSGTLVTLSFARPYLAAPTVLVTGGTSGAPAITVTSTTTSATVLAVATAPSASTDLVFTYATFGV